MQPEPESRPIPGFPGYTITRAGVVEWSRTNSAGAIIAKSVVKIGSPKGAPRVQLALSRLVDGRKVRSKTSRTIARLLWEVWGIGQPVTARFPRRSSRPSSADMAKAGVVAAVETATRTAADVKQAIEDARRRMRERGAEPGET